MTPADQPCRLVVAVALHRWDLPRPALLAARRSAPPALAGAWELPGGKVEAGEAPEQALHREIAEELGVTVALGQEVPPPPTLAVAGAWPLTPRLRMRVWWAGLLAGEPRPLQDHDELRWLGPGELWQVPWLEGDRPLLGALASAMRRW